MSLPPPTLVVADPGAIRRVLLVKLSSLGDVVHSLPLLEALRRGLGPEAHLQWAVRDRFSGLLDGNPHLTGVSLLTGRDTRSAWAFGRELRRSSGGWDVALDAQGLLLSGVLTFLSGAPVRIGFDRNREANRCFLTHPVVPGRTRIHIVDRLLGFCDALGIPRVAPRPQLYLAEAEAEEAKALLAQDREAGPRIGCIVGASTPDKAWPVGRWAELVRLLSSQGMQTVLLGGPGEAETAHRILQEAGGGAMMVSSLVGRTPLRTLASVLARCQVVVGGDSGPTHLAVAVGTPIVGLYGVTDPVRTGPDWGPGPARVLDWVEKEAPPHARRPRHGGAVRDALARIPATAVAEAVVELLCEPVAAAVPRR